MGRSIGAEGTTLSLIMLIYDPGEAYQIDVSHEIVVIESATTAVNSGRAYSAGSWVRLAIPPVIQHYPTAGSKLAADHGCRQLSVSSHPATAQKSLADKTRLLL